MGIEKSTSDAKRRASWILAVCVAVVSTVNFATPSRAADLQLQAVRERLDAIRDVFESTETVLAQSKPRERDLTSMRDTIAPLRSELRERIEEIEPRYNETQKRLKELGSAPAAGSPTEDARITVERATLTSLFSELDGILKQGKLLSLRGDQLAERIEAGRRALFTERLLTRSESILSPALWIPAIQALPGEALSFMTLMQEWKNSAEQRVGYGTIALAFVTIAALIIGLVLIRRALRRRIDNLASKDGDSHDQSRTTYMTLGRTVVDAVTPPLAALASIEVLLAFDLMPSRLDRIANGLLASITLFSVGCAVARAVIAPGAASRRMIALDDEAANHLYATIAAAITTVALATFLHAAHRTLAAPTVVRTATSALMAFLVAIFIARYLLAQHATEDEEKSARPMNFIRFAAGIVAATSVTALTTGHIHFASFLAARLVDALIVIGGTMLLLALIDALFSAGFSSKGPRRRHLAASLGIEPTRLDFFAAIIAGLLRALFFIIAAFLIVGGWGTSVTDVASLAERFNFGFEIGQLRIALLDVLTAVVILLLALVFTRIVHRWLTNTVLPRAKMETGLQNSIATIFVYIGVTLATLLALAQLGINLQNIALVAGALSVGIGFGLQPVVSNFVSGIILLAERTIRVGDIIVVNGEEGYVRRISVRATEIETFERANLIIPNLVLVSNVVKNWTHSNASGRTSLKLGVSYDSDPEKVREILLNTAVQHPQVMRTPEPRVLLLGLGDKVMEFELRCIVANVDFVATVRSDLYFAILRNFRASGIEVPPKG